MKELVVISGKGGTGKTSLTASFAFLAERPVVADCDVDAADLHLLLSPEVREQHDFYSGHEAVIRQDACIGCGACLAYCRFDAVVMCDLADDWAGSGEGRLNCRECDYCRRSCPARTSADIRELRAAMGGSQTPLFTIDPVACEGCGVCVRFCPVKAIDFQDRLCGKWMISDTRRGPMVHARLGVAAENSGKLVSTVRREARRIADEDGHSLVLVDGPPGIGCPVIASVTGADLVLVVTEPTVAGEHDLERVFALTQHFGIPTAICVNKWDLNPEMTSRIEDRARQAGAQNAGRIRYDRAVTLAQMEGAAVVEYQDNGCAQDIREVWTRIGVTA